MKTTGNKGLLQVLWLENGPGQERLVEETLRSEGLSCTLVPIQTEEEFQAALDVDDLDVIISDFSLPRYDGMRALVAARERRPEVPFLFFSRPLSEDQAVEGLKRGATDCIAKGSIRRLGLAVRRALREAGERRRRLDAEALSRESEVRFRQMAEHIESGFWLSDPSGKLLYCNPAYEQILQRLFGSGAWRPDRWLDAVHPSERNQVEEARARQLDGTYDESYRMVLPDGSIFWVREKVFPIRNEGGEVYRLGGTVENITKCHDLEEQLRQARKMEAIGQLAGGVAHDFNNLLTVIRSNADLLLAGLESNRVAGLEYAREIASATERAGNLARQLLSSGRSQAIQCRPLHLNEVIRNMTKMLGLLVGPGVHLAFDLHPKLPLVMADAGMIEQILVNLAINARDAMPQGGKITLNTDIIRLDEARAKLHPEAKTEEIVCVSLSDSGMGIAPEHLPRIFEPFYTTKEARKGTGLGLAIIESLVRQHRGWIEVSTGVGIGTTFSIFLPQFSGSIQESQAGIIVPCATFEKARAAM